MSRVSFDRSRRLAAAALALGLLASACSGGDTPDPTQSPTQSGAASVTPSAGADRGGGTLRLGLASEPDSLTPGFVVDEEGALVADALFDSLVAIDSDLRSIAPAAASGWSIDETGTVYEFTLRADGTFHDGRAVTAADFVRTFQRMTDGANESLAAYKLEAIAGFAEAQTSGKPLSGVEAVADDQLRITLQYPFSEFLQVLADPGLGPTPDVEDLDAFDDSPIGNGPFEMAEPWQHDQFIRASAVEGHRSEPLVDEVLFQIYSGEGSSELQYANFQDGLLDLADVPAESLDEAAATFGTAEDGETGPGLLNATSATLYYYSFNTDIPPFDDPAVRAAVSMLIDREAIAEDVLAGSRVPADTIVPPSLPGAQPGACTHCVFDPEAARAVLLREDGTSILPDPLSLLYNEGESHAAIANRIKTDIEDALGITVEVSEASLQEIVKRIRDGEVQMFRLGWLAEYPGLGSYLVPLFSTQTQGVTNLSRFSDPDVDALLEQAEAEQDWDARTALFQQAEEAILGAAPIAPVVFYRLNRVVGAAVHDLRVDPLGRIDLTRVWLER